jgi:tetratricopeptide (TPR) repeat protein
LRAFDEAQLAVLEGDIDRAAQIAKEAQEAAPDEVLGDLQGRHAIVRIECALEVGDLASASAIAADYLDRRGSWFSATRFWDALPLALAAAESAGLVSAEDAEQQRDVWIKEKSTILPSGAVWAAAYAPIIHLSRAMAAASRHDPKFMLHRFPMAHADAGRVLLAIGRTEDALTHLRIAPRICYATTNAFAHVRASLDLGEALEKIGDPTNAIAAYGTVLERWGEKAPHALTTRRARERLTALS